VVAATGEEVRQWNRARRRLTGRGKSGQLADEKNRDRSFSLIDDYSDECPEAPLWDKRISVD